MRAGIGWGRLQLFRDWRVAVCGEKDGEREVGDGIPCAERVEVSAAPRMEKACWKGVIERCSVRMVAHGGSIGSIKCAIAFGHAGLGISGRQLLFTA